MANLYYGNITGLSDSDIKLKTGRQACTVW